MTGNREVLGFFLTVRKIQTRESGFEVCHTSVPQPRIPVHFLKWGLFPVILRYFRVQLFYIFMMPLGYHYKYFYMFKLRKVKLSNSFS